MRMMLALLRELTHTAVPAWLLAGLLSTGCATKPPAMYAVTWEGNILRAMPNSGVLEPIGICPGGRVNGLAASPDGRLYCVHNALSTKGSNDVSRLIEINPANGRVVRTVPLSENLDIRALSFDRKGRLVAIANYSASSTTDNVVAYAIDKRTGDCSKIGDAGIQALQALCLGPDGVLYGYCVKRADQAASLGLIEIDTESGVAWRLASPSRAVLIQSITFAPSGELLGVGQPNGSSKENARLYTIAPDTGEATEICELAAWDIRGIEYLPVSGRVMSLSR